MWDVKRRSGFHRLVVDVAEPSRSRRGSEGDARSAAGFEACDHRVTRRLQLYRGEIGPEAVLTSTDTEDVQVATLAYGLGNWYLLRGDKAQARSWFERSIQSGGWPAFDSSCRRWSSAGIVDRARQFGGNAEALSGRTRFTVLSQSPFPLRDTDFAPLHVALCNAPRGRHRMADQSGRPFQQ